MPKRVARMQNSVTTSTDLLEHHVDAYRCVHIPTSGLPADPKLFRGMLDASVAKWGAQELKAVWLKIPTDLNILIPVAMSMGFEFHHAKPDYLMLALWMGEGENTLPAYCTHSIGVGGFVVKDDKVLVIKEKNGPVTSIWKMPGGMVDEGEDIHDAAVREVLEETGIRTEFVSMLTFRQNHSALWHTSNLYCICVLRAITTDIAPQESEIAEAAWMPMSEFLSLPYYKGVYKAIIDMAGCYHKGELIGWGASRLPIVFRQGYDTLYHPLKFDTRPYAQRHPSL